MIAQFLCAAVLLMVSVSTLVAHRLVIDHAQQSAAQWARAQAQALGQGGLMWALARLEDPRPLDAQCRVAPSGPGVRRFAELAEMAERQSAWLSCDVHEATDAASPARPWSCRCGQGAADDLGTGVTPMLGQAQTTQGQAAQEQGARAAGRLEWTFQAEGQAAAPSGLLKLVVRAQWLGSGGLAHSWSEQVVLRKDSQAVWRMVVGSWWDDRP